MPTDICTCNNQLQPHRRMKACPPNIKDEVLQLIRRDIAYRRRHGVPLPMGYILHPEAVDGR